MAYFLSEDETPAWYAKKAMLPELKKYMEHEQYADAIKLLHEEELDSELAYLFAYCATECGKIALHNGNLITASKYFAQAESLLLRSWFPSDGLKARILLYDSIAKNISSPGLAFDSDSYSKLRKRVISEELYQYISGNLEYEYSDEILSLSIEAKRYIKAKRYRDALSVLEALEDRKSDPAMSAHLLFHIYSDMEICHRELQDYEKAYRYASKRMAQMNAFKN